MLHAGAAALRQGRLVEGVSDPALLAADALNRMSDEADKIAREKQ